MQAPVDLLSCKQSSVGYLDHVKTREVSFAEESYGIQSKASINHTNILSHLYKPFRVCSVVIVQNSKDTVSGKMLLIIIFDRCLKAM